MKKENQFFSYVLRDTGWIFILLFVSVCALIVAWIAFTVIFPFVGILTFLVVLILGWVAAFKTWMAGQ